ncbi:tropomyosin-like [Dunckerocampus dactyliophorus]|uniref:tropomyosin-like n=1 Tax=Dunckerocampus dactyliophorus TaxID=161453 RepID=UPI0024072603|nr:tropomyosin-like [Dunckerocampus dactyliophorus]
MATDGMRNHDLLGSFSPLKSMHMKLMNFHYSAIAEKDHYHNEFHISTLKNIKLRNLLSLQKAEFRKNSEIMAEQAEEIAQLKESLQGQQAELQQSKVKVKKQQAQMFSLEQSVQEQLTELQQSEKKVQMQKSQICSLERAIQEQQEVLQQSEQKAQMQEAQIASLQQNLQDQLAQLEHSEQKVEVLEEKFQSYIESAEQDKRNQKVKEEMLMDTLRACQGRLNALDDQINKKKDHFWSGIWKGKKTSEKQEKDERRKWESEKAEKKEFNTKLKSEEEMTWDERLEKNRKETPKQARQQRKVAFNI